MIPNTVNQTALFVTLKPAWESGVNLNQTLEGDIQISRAGLEQRQARGYTCRWKISYLSVMNGAARKAREKRALAEITSPLWVPFWTEEAFTAGPMAADLINIDRPATVDWFRPGDWILMDGPEGLQFRQVAEVGENPQQLELEPLTGWIDYPAGTRVYPCRACIREQGQAPFEPSGDDTHGERLTFSTL